MIDLGSRPTLPRVDMGPLAAFLNIYEKEKMGNPDEVSQEMRNLDSITASIDTVRNGDGEVQTGEVVETFSWHSDRITDSGPILRLNSNTNKLSKAARYGHPYERSIYSSLITPVEMKAIVLSFFKHAYCGGTVLPQRDHEWCDLHEFNRDIDWTSWKPSTSFSQS